MFQIIKSILILNAIFNYATSNSIRTRRSVTGPYWPDTLIAYEISGEFHWEAYSKIESALESMQTLLQVGKSTCIKFVPHEDETNYILFTDNGDCSSEIGFREGVNRISLNNKCLTNGNIIHQIMHRLGFDHEHSRSDRDDYIEIDIFNIDEDSRNRSNFEINLNESMNQSPYDYHSILHYNSFMFQKNKSYPVMKSRIDSFKTENIIDIDRTTMSKIDIIRVQNIYDCKQIKLPDISHEYDMEDSELRSRIEKRFELEAAYLKKDKLMIDAYLNKTFDTCGMYHYWPFDYPLVESDHKYYQLYCQEKKKTLERCLFSIECGPNDEAVCVRPFFKKTGRCIKPGSVGRKINDQMFKQVKKIKDIFG